MPMRLDPRDQKLLIIFAAAMVGVIVLVFALVPSNNDDPGYPSSTSAHSHGAKAAYLTLEESGYKVERWYDEPAQLPRNGKGTTLILAQPWMTGGTDAKTQIARYVSDGGRVLAVGSWAGTLLPKNGVTYLTVPRTEWKEAAAVLPSRLTRGGAFQADQEVKWEPSSPDEIVHFSSEDGAAVISYRFGKGEVIWWASAVPMMNGGISKPGNLELFLNSVGEPGRRVLWDEYFHSTHHSLYGTVADTPLKFFGWQFLVFAIALVATYSRRSGPLRRLPEEPRLSPMEFIETLGGLYRQFKQPGLAVEVVYERFRLQLMRRTGIKPDAEPEIVAKMAKEKFDVDDCQLVEDLRRFKDARYNHELSEKDALAMVRRIAEYQSELLGTGKRERKH